MSPKYGWENGSVGIIAELLMIVILFILNFFCFTLPAYVYLRKPRRISFASDSITLHPVIKMLFFALNHSYGNVFRLHVHFQANQTHFCTKTRFKNG